MLMSQTNKSKQNIILLACLLSFTVCFVAAGVLTIALFAPAEEQESTAALPPLVAEPDRIDFQAVEEGEHEGIAHLVNQSDREIVLLFASSSCSCSMVELPSNTILPGEKLPHKVYPFDGRVDGCCQR